MEQGRYAVFNCRYNCSVIRTHTLFWVVGDLPVLQRTFLRGRTSNFIERSGLYVEVMDVSTCARDGRNQGQAIEQLRINASSAEQYNRTAVQCVAYATNPSDPSFYSSYSIMLITSGIYNYSKPNLCVSNNHEQVLVPLSFTKIQGLEYEQFSWIAT